MSDFILKDGERIDDVNDGIRLIQKKDGLTFGTDALLLAGYIKGGSSLNAAELGGGTGIISLLLASRKKLGKITVFEVQEDFADLSKRNIENNSLGNIISVINKDIREASLSDVGGKGIDVVFSNPPYMKSGSGKENENEGKNIARREICGDIFDFCECASRLLRFGGSFYAVYLPERLSDLFSAMKKCGIEPKRLTLVLPDVGKAPCLVLLEGKKGGKEGLFVTKPLYIKENSKDSNAFTYIMEHGDFDERFKQK